MTFDEFKSSVATMGFRAIERGRGHWQIRQSAINPMVINWYPRTGTVWITEKNERFDDCSVDAVLAIASETFKGVA